MIYLKHVGIYVINMDKEKRFYENVFGMKYICEDFNDSNEMLDELYEMSNSKAIITKLITSYGEQTGMAQMVELIKVQGQISDIDNKKLDDNRINEPGKGHLCFGVDGMNETLERVIAWGGVQKTKVYTMGKNYCCFCVDPEGNWIELIALADRLR